MRNKRFFAWGGNAFLYVMAVAGLLGLLNYLSARHYHLADLTGEQVYTLSDQTVRTLEGLIDDITVIGFVKDDPSLRAAPTALLERYRYHNDKFDYRLSDPDREPKTAERYGVTRYDSYLVLGADDARELVTGGLDEEKLTNAILRVTAEGGRKVYFVTGHGERGMKETGNRGISSAAAELEKEGYAPETLSLASVETVPEDAVALIIPGPSKDLLEREQGLLAHYLENGGAVLFMADPLGLNRTAKFIARYGVTLNDDVVVDQLGRQLGGDYLMPSVLTYNKKHPVTKGFDLLTVYALARSLSLGDGGEGTEVTFLASTQPESWGESDTDGVLAGKAQFDPDEDRNGPLVLAAAVTLDHGGRMIVTGDSDFAVNAYLGMQGNRDLFMNAVNWLAGDEDKIAIRPRTRAMDPLMFSSNEIYGLAAVALLIIPGVVLAAGIVVNLRRRRQ